MTALLLTGTATEADAAVVVAGSVAAPAAAGVGEGAAASLVGLLGFVSGPSIAGNFTNAV
jgi:hypothetical protein